jgi:hypothetical protein
VDDSSQIAYDDKEKRGKKKKKSAETIQQLRCASESDSVTLLQSKIALRTRDRSFKQLHKTLKDELRENTHTKYI